MPGPSDAIVGIGGRIGIIVGPPGCGGIACGGTPCGGTGPDWTPGGVIVDGIPRQLPAGIAVPERIAKMLGAAYMG